MFRKFSIGAAILSLIIMCLASFCLMLWASRGDSAIDDELAHIPAGYGYVHNLDYRLNPEHPPLVKALAMLPVLLLQPNFPVTNAAWTMEVNGQWDMGAAFLYQSGNDANEIIRTARFFPILITLLVIILIYFLARRLIGPLWALLPATLFAFDPTALAHGHYVTTDVGAAFGIIFATFYFLQFVGAPSRKNLWYAGLSFGVAQIAKFSTPLLVPLFIFLALVLWARDMALAWHRTAARFASFARDLGRWAWRIFLIFVIGYAIIVYPAYFLFTYRYPVARQVSDTQQILGSFAGGPTPAGSWCRGERCLADLDIRMAGNAVTRPLAQYMLGVLMVLQRADGGNTIYFLGAVRGAGGPWYFPILFLLKEPLPTLAIVLVALVFAVLWIIKKGIAGMRRRGPGIWANILKYLQTNFAEFSMASFVVLYWGYSMHSTLNIGIRHIIPTLPFIYILAAGVWKKWITQFDFSFGAMVGSSAAPVPGSLVTGAGTASLDSIIAGARGAARWFLFSALKYMLLVVLVAWLILETLWAAPYFLSYFNEIGGGVWGGYRYVTDSNYDWGQDLLRLQAFVNEHPEIDKIAVDYFGGGNPQYYLGDKEVDWNSAKGDPTVQGIHWIAISINQLQGDIEPLAPGQTRNASDTYSWLTALRPIATSSRIWPFGTMGNVPTPDYRAGTSIFIYHLP